jgi:hypothetical protein
VNSGIENQNNSTGLIYRWDVLVPMDDRSHDFHLQRIRTGVHSFETLHGSSTRLLESNSLSTLANSKPTFSWPKNYLSHFDVNSICKIRERVP